MHEMYVGMHVVMGILCNSCMTLIGVREMHGRMHPN